MKPFIPISHKKRLYRIIGKLYVLVTKIYAYKGNFATIKRAVTQPIMRKAVDMSLNHVSLYGRVSREPIQRETKSGQPVISFGFCVNERYKQGDKYVDQPNFLDCAAFGDKALNWKRYLVKGKPFIIEGKLHWDKWQDPNSGKNNSKVEIIVNNIVFTSNSIEEVPEEFPVTPTPLADEDIPF